MQESAGDNQSAEGRAQLRDIETLDRQFVLNRSAHAEQHMPQIVIEVHALVQVLDRRMNFGVRKHVVVDAVGIHVRRDRAAEGAVGQ